MGVSGFILTQIEWTSLCSTTMAGEPTFVSAGMQIFWLIKGRINVTDIVTLKDDVRKWDDGNEGITVYNKWRVSKL